jgi:2-dehydropantoate 2-reductase
MRFVIFGAGAIGGVVGARLHQGGYDVALIARGAHLEAIRRDGLTLETPTELSTLRLPAGEDPAELEVGGDDVVLLATKSQDTAGALNALRAAGADDVPVVCVQNGVENERAASRMFEEVYGAVVMCPTAHLEPGVVQAFGTALTGIIDVGAYPGGSDGLCRTVADALGASHFSSRVQTEIMRFKYAKLLLNLGNAVTALCGVGEQSDELVEQVKAEGRAALTAAGIGFDVAVVGDLEARHQTLGVQAIEGRRRAGSSSWQSLARRTGAIETDYINGEIALLGRLHGVATPINAALCTVAGRYARQGRAPGELTRDDLLAVLG